MTRVKYIFLKVYHRFLGKIGIFLFEIENLCFKSDIFVEKMNINYRLIIQENSLSLLNKIPYNNTK